MYMLFFFYSSGDPRHLPVPSHSSPPRLSSVLDMRVWGEELFGPVAMIFRVPDLDAAIEVANATDFGLGSNVWTSDPQEAERFVDEVVAGAVFEIGRAHV